MGQLYGVTFDINVASALDDFEVIEIVDDKNPYPTLLGLEWAIDMKGVINLKKRTMSFDKKLLKVEVPLDPTKEVCYIEPVHDYEESEDEL